MQKRIAEIDDALAAQFNGESDGTPANPLGRSCFHGFGKWAGFEEEITVRRFYPGDGHAVYLYRLIDGERLDISYLRVES